MRGTPAELVELVSVERALGSYWARAESKID